MSWEEIRESMRGLSAEMGGPPPELESSLRQRFRRRKRASSSWPWAAAAALAIGVGIGAWVSLEQEPPDPPQRAFLLLDHGRPTRELTSGRLVRVTLPPTAAAWFGLPVDPGARRGVEAEVLLGDDGVAQAVRFVE